MARETSPASVAMWRQQATSVAATFLNEVLLPVAVDAHFTKVIHCSSRTVCRDEEDPELTSAAVMSTNFEVNDQISELAVLTGLECRGVTGTKRLPANSPQWTFAGARVRRGMEVGRIGFQKKELHSNIAQCRELLLFHKWNSGSSEKGCGAWSSDRCAAALESESHQDW